MILFIDTETTGKVDFRMPPGHECQPRMVQFAAILADDDGTERATVALVIDCDGFEIPAEASAVHGITKDIAWRCGVSEAMAVSIFDRLLRKANTIAAHSLDFDLAVLEAAHLRVRKATGASATFEHLLADRRRVCTMKTATPVCRILHAKPRRPDDWKWPKLEECIRHFFGEELAGAHDALTDARACKRIYFRLMELEKAA